MYGGFAYDFCHAPAAKRSALLKEHTCLRCESGHPKKHPYWHCKAAKPVRPFAGGLTPAALKAAVDAAQAKKV